MRMRNLWMLFVFSLATGFISEKLLVSSQSSSPSADDLYLEGRPSGDFPVDDEDDEDFTSGSGSGDYTVVLKDETFKKFLFGSPHDTPNQEVFPNLATTTQDSPPNPSTTPGDIQTSTTAEDTVTSSYILPEEEMEKETEVSENGPTADSFSYGTDPSSTGVPPSESAPATTRSTDGSVTGDGVPTEDGEEGFTTKISGGDVVKEDAAEDGLGSRIYEVDVPEEVTSENMWERAEVLAAVIACGVIGFLCAIFLLILLAYRMKKKDEGSYDLGGTKLPPTAYQKAPTKEFYA
ncbi:uncharacterized protein ACJ7VT_022630 [Polymixia lowei]